MTQPLLPCSLLRNRRRFLHYRYLSVALFALISSPSVTKSFSTSLSRSFTTVVSSSTQRQQKQQRQNLFVRNKFHLTAFNDEHQRLSITTASSVLSRQSLSVLNLNKYSFLSYRGGDASSNRGITTTKTILRSASTITDLEKSQTKEKEQFNMSTLSPEEKLTALRQKMKELHLDVYMIPTDDPHLSGTFEWKGKLISLYKFLT